MAKPLLDDLINEMKTVREESAKLRSDNQDLIRKNSDLAAQAASFLRTLKEQTGPIREHTVSCPGLVVGCYVMGVRIFGRVVWVGNGGGIWKGQELCRIDSIPGVFPSMDFEVVKVS